MQCILSYHGIGPAGHSLWKQQRHRDASLLTFAKHPRDDRSVIGHHFAWRHYYWHFFLLLQSRVGRNDAVKESFNRCHTEEHTCAEDVAGAASSQVLPFFRLKFTLKVENVFCCGPKLHLKCETGNGKLKCLRYNHYIAISGLDCTTVQTAAEKVAKFGFYVWRHLSL